jgi:hypothetical protein
MKVPSDAADTYKRSVQLKRFQNIPCFRKTTYICVHVDPSYLKPMSHFFVASTSICVTEKLG